MAIKNDQLVKNKNCFVFKSSLGSCEVFLLMYKDIYNYSLATKITILWVESFLHRHGDRTVSLRDRFNIHQFIPLQMSSPIDDSKISPVLSVAARCITRFINGSCVERGGGRWTLRIRQLTRYRCPGSARGPARGKEGDSLESA